MLAFFYKLNRGWNAEPNAPLPHVEIQGGDVLLNFCVNPYQFEEFQEGERGVLRFVRCSRYRLGNTNDEGWYVGQCRFSKLAPAWGEFYRVQADPGLLDAPSDWQQVRPNLNADTHFLFYFRDETFECTAERCVLEPSQDNALFRRGKVLVLE